MRRLQNINSGQTLFEVIVAIGIAALVLLALVSLSTTSVRNSTFSKNYSLATKYALEGSEWVRSQRDGSLWSQFYSTRVGSWCVSALAWAGYPCGSAIAGTQFYREAVITSLSSDSVRVVISVRWDDGQGTHRVESPTVLTNWRK